MFTCSTVTRVETTGIMEEKEQDQAVNAWKSMSMRDKYCYVIANITVEPILACYVIPSVLAGLATQNLNLEKACRVNLGHNDTVCSALAARETEKYDIQEREVQVLVAGMTVWKSILQGLLPAFVVLFLGSWSDRHARRKPGLLMPIIGEFMTSVGLLLCTFFFLEWPMEVAGVVEGLFPALTGGWMAMFVSVFSYIADVTTKEMRTFRIGIVNVFVYLGIPIGTALSGILFRKLGFYGMFSLAAVLYAMGFVYGSWRIKEVRAPIPRPANTTFLGDFFDLRHVYETFIVAFKKRAGSRKQRVILLMILSVVLVGPMYGEGAVSYLFARYRFNWNEVDFSYFATYCIIVHLFGTLIAVVLLSHLLQIDDALIGLIGCFSKIAASFVFAFSTQVWMFYLGPLVDILAGASLITMRSMASKIVPIDELGKVNSLIGMCEAFSPILYSPMYSKLYAETLGTMPGAFFLLGSGLIIPAVFIFLWLYLLQKREIQLEGQEEAQNTKPKVEGGVNEGFQDDELELSITHKQETNISKISHDKNN